ncbi:hypothetical protein CC78DRAFT_324809 [Lojkania enalia]|uniref:Uncharacterized protein n=1 Tax=Lojkania enalia TaxID=147567 RepID=A0A9P4K4V5_9PLEO|nr:hypothetical protein CC78DRAFT_324809 [Didymosphaeria enalia]
MSAPTVAAPQPHANSNGVVPVDAREAEFLARLMQIRDEVFASKHPRIQLPPKVLEQVTPRPPQYTPPFLSRPSSNGIANGSRASQSYPSRLESSQRQPGPAEYSTPPQTAQRPFTGKSTSSGIDPVLLTKSDHLIRAEIQLKRQQIERTLKDQFDKKGREKEMCIDYRFDVEDILAKAHELVKPLSGLSIAVDHSEGSESFDENSYYSSKANSWSSEDVESNQNINSAVAAERLNLQANRSTNEGQLAGPAKSANAPVKEGPTAVIDLDDEYEPAEDIEIYEPELAGEREEPEESDYSPPPADVGPSDPSRARSLERGADSHGGINGSSRRQSPVGHPPPIQNSRKRRRQERQEERRRQQANKRALRSPEPYIKEEPQSPPPFASYPDAQPSKRRALQPLSNDIEVLSAREGRQQPVYYREQDHSPRHHRQVEEPLSPAFIRVPQRRVERDQDLRRVASLQYARRPHSPGAEPYQPAEVRHIRAASHTFFDRPVEHVYREASARPSATPRYVLERSRSPIHEYAPRAQSPMVMVPPQRRIVLDQFGNRYYAAPADVRESVAPPNRRIETEPYFERAVTREPTMRAPARTELLEGHDVQRMPPPPPRRYIEASDVDAIEGRPYRQREASHRPVEVEYVPREVVERRPMMYEDMTAPREYVPSRAYSMRPEIVRRDAQGDYASTRHESVQPGYVRVAAPRYREVSVAHQEPYDEHRYTYAAPPQGRRFGEGVAERPIELAQDPYIKEGQARRVSYHF